MKDKHGAKFFIFHKKDFYPSITEDLSKKALNFTNDYINLLKCDTDLIDHVRKSLVFDSTHVWIKKQRGLFDVAMGDCDGARVCELVGTRSSRPDRCSVKKLYVEISQNPQESTCARVSFLIKL